MICLFICLSSSHPSIHPPIFPSIHPSICHSFLGQVQGTETTKVEPDLMFQWEKQTKISTQAHKIITNWSVQGEWKMTLNVCTCLCWRSNSFISSGQSRSPWGAEVWAEARRKRKRQSYEEQRKRLSSKESDICKTLCSTKGRWAHLLPLSYTIEAHMYDYIMSGFALALTWNNENILYCSCFLKCVDLAYFSSVKEGPEM